MELRVQHGRFTSPLAGPHKGRGRTECAARPCIQKQATRHRGALPRITQQCAIRATKIAMRQALKLHPDSVCLATTDIAVDVAHPRAGSLVLYYFVTGKINDLRIPPVIPGGHADELWRHTCFEAFIRGSQDEGYHEFNFAPSTQWAAYRFSSYRSGMRVATEISAPRIEVQSEDGLYTLQASLDLDRASSLRRDAVWRLGLSAVLEETSGRKSYWALAHPPGKPDFHHSVCFAHEISAA
jgi:hypothetical protein